jgi:mono/diheme cytochrome c family protein
MRTWRALAVAVVAALLVACGKSEPPIDNGEAVAGGEGTINLEQGWSKDQQDHFWFMSFGSRLVPLAWLRVLEQAGGEQRFMGNAHMDALGFLVQSATPANPDAFPVGFTRDKDAKGTEWAGLGCAACHTGEVRYKGHRIRLDGGAGMLDFDTFESELIASLKATSADAAKFARFVKALKTPDEKRDALRAEIDARAAKLDARHTMNHVDVAYGHGRLDAFGQIFNAVAVEFLELPANRRAPDAPVSLPVLWDAPHLDVVQWNGSAPNAGPGPLLQNVTTALAVYGFLDISGHDGLDGYPSNVNFDHLGQIQDGLYALQAPQWPAAILGAIDAERAGRGAKVYAQECQSCHALSDRNDAKRELRAVMTPADIVGTDPRMVQNFLDARAATGAFGGHKEGVLVGPVFGSDALTGDLVVHAAVGATLRHPLAAIRDAVLSYHSVMKAAIDHRPNSYKARPLSGVWASAPYLHNGSVPTLADLLEPTAQRPQKFFVGSREFDADQVGVAAAVTKNASEFDTSQPGNSNLGHTYGTTLGDADKRDLLEYLKTL